MTTLEIIKDLCAQEGISLSALEKEMNYGNGSLSKAAKIPSDRILELSRRFGKSMEYLMTGEDTSDADTVKDESERRLLMLCRKAGEVSQEEKDAIIDSFENSIDLFLKAKGIKKGE